jgi:hypothetical protein
VLSKAEEGMHGRTIANTTEAGMWAAMRRYEGITDPDLAGRLVAARELHPVSLDEHIALGPSA